MTTSPPSGAEHIVLAFDRDETVDVNPHPEKQAVPLSWIQHLNEETHHEVWAIGNQKLKAEASVPGVREAVLELENEWYREFSETENDDEVDGWPRRARRVTMLSELFPDAEGYVVVDDKDLSYVEGWDHYYPWEFVEAVRDDRLRLDLPVETLT
ncbi:MAG: adaptin protein [Halapricum sp.]